MLFLQPVVVNDTSAADRSPPAEVRVAEARTPEQATWTEWSGLVLAQSSLESRSPFGANAVDRNDVTPPGPAPSRPTDTVTPPPATPNTPKPADSMSNTRIPPPETATPGQPDAGPPPPVSGTGAAPGATSTGGTGDTPATLPDHPYQPSSSTYPGAREGTTLPGASSGASNTQ